MHQIVAKFAKFFILASIIGLRKENKSAKRDFSLTNSQKKNQPFEHNNTNQLICQKKKVCTKSRQLWLEFLKKATEGAHPPQTPPFATRKSIVYIQMKAWSNNATWVCQNMIRMCKNKTDLDSILHWKCCKTLELPGASPPGPPPGALPLDPTGPLSGPLDPTPWSSRALRASIFNFHASASLSIIPIITPPLKNSCVRLCTPYTNVPLFFCVCFVTLFCSVYLFEDKLFSLLLAAPSWIIVA